MVTAEAAARLGGPAPSTSSRRWPPAAVPRPRRSPTPTGLPLPTVYRLVRELLDGDYLVHIREDKRFELGYKLHAPRRLACTSRSGSRARCAPRSPPCTSGSAPRPTSRCTAAPRSSSSSPPTRRPTRGCPPWSSATTRRRTPPRSARSCSPTWTTEQRLLHLDPEPMPRSGPGTITRPRRACSPSSTPWPTGASPGSSASSSAGATCAAAAVRGASGALVGSVAVSGAGRRVRRSGRAEVEAALRDDGVPGQPGLPVRRGRARADPGFSSGR